MRDFVRQHVIDRAFDHLVAVFLRDPDQLLEDVARQSFETAVDSGDPRRGILGLGAAPQHLGFDVVARLGAHIFEQELEDFGVARFVPDLARHIELEFPWGVGKIEQRTSCRFHRLHLAAENSVQSRAQRLFVEGHHAIVETLLLANLTGLARAHQDEAILARASVRPESFVSIDLTPRELARAP